MLTAVTVESTVTALISSLSVATAQPLTLEVSLVDVHTKMGSTPVSGSPRLTANRDWGRLAGEDQSGGRDASAATGLMSLDRELDFVQDRLSLSFNLRVRAWP